MLNEMVCALHKMAPPFVCLGLTEMVQVREVGAILKSKGGRGLPDKILSSNDTDGHCVAKGVQFNLFMLFEVLLAEENVEVGVLLS